MPWSQLVSRDVVAARLRRLAARAFLLASPMAPPTHLCRLSLPPELTSNGWLGLRWAAPCMCLAGSCWWDLCEGRHRAIVANRRVELAEAGDVGGAYFPLRASSARAARLAVPPLVAASSVDRIPTTHFAGISVAVDGHHCPARPDAPTCRLCASLAGRAAK